jgi:DNA polymerase-3 subunit gamma/tau
MSYQVLARKWRPQVFDDVVGQGHITRTLQNAIATNRLAHAFLFSGPRGVGKTTTARILAKALNCKEGPTPNPCGKCDSCLETAAGTSVDVIEIDGASNRGIEHIRELRETVKYAPAGGKYKVYVIDEVHMLTNEAFNALLKTLEEPPPHVIFIFATTEPQKIPATIHSRCQRYGFKRIAVGEIAGKLRSIADQEGITVSDQGLVMIGRAAEGSMRDSQSLLDQALSYSGTTISDQDLQTILGAVAQETLRTFAAGLFSRDAAGLIRQVDRLMEQGQDMRQFLLSAVEHVRNLIVVALAKEPGQIIELPAADVELLRQQAAGIEPAMLIMIFDSLSRTFEEMRWSPYQRFTLEVGLVKACSAAPLKPLEDVLARMQALEARLALPDAMAEGQAHVVRDRVASYSAPKRTGTKPQTEASVPAVSAPGAGGELWAQIHHVLKEKKPGLAALLGTSRVLESSEGGLIIGLAGSPFQLDQVNEKENRDIVTQLAAELGGRPMTLSFRLIAEGKNQEAKIAAPKKPAPRQTDPLVQDALSIFNGRIVDTDRRGKE